MKFSKLAGISLVAAPLTIMVLEVWACFTTVISASSVPVAATDTAIEVCVQAEPLEVEEYPDFWPMPLEGEVEHETECNSLMTVTKVTISGVTYMSVHPAGGLRDGPYDLANWSFDITGDCWEHLVTAKGDEVWACFTSEEEDQFCKVVLTPN